MIVTSAVGIPLRRPPLRLTARRVKPACGPTHSPITDHVSYVSYKTTTIHILDHVLDANSNRCTTQPAPRIAVHLHRASIAHYIYNSQSAVQQNTTYTNTYIRHYTRPCMAALPMLTPPSQRRLTPRRASASSAVTASVTASVSAASPEGCCRGCRL